MNIKATEFYVQTKKGEYVEIVPEFFKFPGGEWQMKPLTNLPEEAMSYQAVLRGADLDDIMKVVLWGSYFDRKARTEGGFHPVSLLFVPYLPAARSDKGVEEAAGAYTRLLTAGQFTSIHALDVHSQEARNLGQRVVQDAGYHGLVVAAIAASETKYDGVIAPDAGARARASVAARYLGVPLYIAEKKRNQETGAIVSYKVPELPEGGRYLVVDDICDGGATFVHLASGVTVRQLDLLVTHGIFSRGTEVILDAYDQVFCTDSVATDKPGVTVIPALPHMRLGY